MTWKPTDEMVELGMQLMSTGYDRPGMTRWLIEVQPLIAEEATEPLHVEIAHLRLDLLGARAKALEEAAAIAFNRCRDPDNSFELLDAIRALIPKPPEGT